MAVGGAGGGPVNRNWRTAALCATADDPDLWFPASLNGHHALQAEQAKATCRRCPVMTQCQAWALDSGVDDGIWGGLDWDELRLLRRREHRGKGRPEPLPCGTPAAYQRHIRRREPIDDACRKANRADKAAQAARRAQREAA